MFPINQGVSPEFQVFLQRVRLLDLKPIAAQLLHVQSQLTSTSIIRAIADYLEFLYLVDCHPQFQLVPTLEVDEVWHHHILDTRKYTADCQILFGKLIHRSAFVGVCSEADRLAQLEAFALTQTLYRHYFGRTIESNPADCRLFVEDATMNYSVTNGLLDEVLAVLQQSTGQSTHKSTLTIGAYPYTTNK